MSWKCPKCDDDEGVKFDWPATLKCFRLRGELDDYLAERVPGRRPTYGRCLACRGRVKLPPETIARDHEGRLAES